jgi:hypothetical protein
MKAERWEKVIDLFQSALERAPEERDAFLDETCHDDESMRREVQSLLTSHERAEGTGNCCASSIRISCRA